MATGDKSVPDHGVLGKASCPDPCVARVDRLRRLNGSFSDIIIINGDIRRGYRETCVIERLLRDISAMADGLSK